MTFAFKKGHLSLSESKRYVVCVVGVDLLKGLDGLCGLIWYLSLNPTNGDVYVFFNKSRTTMKLLHRERDRVSHKVFIKEEVGFRSLRWDELVLLLEGINPAQWLSAILEEIPKRENPVNWEQLLPNKYI